jgi:hypothetical protein
MVPLLAASGIAPLLSKRNTLTLTVLWSHCTSQRGIMHALLSYHLIPHLLIPRFDYLCAFALFLVVRVGPRVPAVNIHRDPPL